jgi:SAM-dependent methyltransferase
MAKLATTSSMRTTTTTSLSRIEILNLGCGTKTSTSAEVVNIDRHMYHRLKKNPILRAITPLFLRGERLERFASLPPNIVVHDLRKRLPFDTNSVAVVYHSHFLPHIDRNPARKLLSEVKRVLRPNGIHRIVVPDFERVCKDYLLHIAACESDPRNSIDHEDYISAVIELFVRREASGTSEQSTLRRYFENLLLGDARKRGETYQWAYDRISLCELLVDIGFRNPEIHEYNTSKIPNWSKYGLDTDEFGNQYKPESLYIEAQK